MRPLDITATVNTSLTPTLDHAAVTTLASRIAKWSWTIRGLGLGPQNDQRQPDQ